MRSLLRGCWCLLILGGFGCPVSEWVADYGIEVNETALVNGEPSDAQWSTFESERGSGFPAGRYESDDTRIDVVLSSTGIDLEIENRTEEPLTVYWSETMLDGDYESPLLRADSGPRKELEPPQPPTQVAPGSIARFRLIPGPPGEWQPFTYSENEGFWQRSASLFGLEIDSEDDEDSRRQLAREAIGLDLRLHLPVEILGERNDLILPMEVSEATVRPVYY